MRVLRIIVGLVFLAYALMSLVVAGAMAAFKVGVFSPPPDAPAEQLQLMADTGWPQLALWFIAVALYFLVAIKLFRRAKTFVFWAVAFTIDLVLLLWSKAGPSYEAALSPEMLAADYGILGVNLVLGGLIWIMGRTHLD